MSSSQGIQLLLEAEKEASKIVEKARSYRVQRLKDARLEAQKEIEILKQQKTKQFMEYEQQFAVDAGIVNLTKVRIFKVAVKQTQLETEQNLVKNRAEFNKNKDLVIEKLLLKVAECNN
jgi:V-type H+-transporting ATPase subunit G